MNVDNTKMMDIKNIVLRFGGVVAIQNISFDIFSLQYIIYHLVL